MKKANRLLSLLLSICMLLSIFPAPAVMAADASANTTLTVNEETVNVGETITVSITNPDMNFQGLALKMYFDNTLVTCTEMLNVDEEDGDDDLFMYYLNSKGKEKTMYPMVGDTIEDTNGDGVFQFAMMPGEDTDFVEGTIVTFTFVAEKAGVVTFKLDEECVGQSAFKGTVAAYSVTILDAAAPTYNLFINGVAADSFEEGTDLTEILGTPAKEGKEFDGWKFYSDAANTTEVTLVDNKMPAYDLYAVAQWKDAVVPYTLKFVDENGTELDAYTYMDGWDRTPAYPNYTKTNYTITWSAEIPATLTQDMEIAAIATPNVYTVDFYNGNEIGSEKATKDNNWTVAAPTGLTKTADATYHYTFAGWDTDVSADEVVYNSVSIAATGDMNLYAVFTAEAHAEGDTKDHKCDTCGYDISACKDENPKDHKCDVCETPMGDEHKAAEGSHNCAYCGQAVTACADLVTNVSEIAATCMATGTEAHMECTVCGKLYQTINGAMTEVTAADLVIPVDETAHVYSETISGYDKTDSTHTAYHICTLNAEHAKKYDAAEPHSYDATSHECVCEKVEEFTVTFYDLRSGDPHELGTVTAEYGSDISAQVAAAQKAFEDLYSYMTFKEWRKMNGGKVEDLSTMPGENLDVYAEGSYKSYTVTWVADGEIVDTESVEYKKTPTKTPAVPAKTGYSGAWDYNGAAITGDTTITAVYTTNEYTLTIDLGEHGTFADGMSTAAVKAEYATAPEYPEFTANEGYKLTGWNVTIGENTTTASKLPETMLASDATYTAVWELVDVTVKFNEGDTKELTGKYFSKVTAPTLNKEGHTFLGWAASTADDAEVLYKGGDEITLNKDVDGKTLYAKWEVKTYNIIWDLDGGSYGDELPETAQYGEKVSLPHSMYLTKPGATFDSWSVSGGVKVESDENAWEVGSYCFIMPAKDVTIKATWYNIDYYIYIYDNEGEIIDEYVLYYGDVIGADDMPEIPAKESTAQYDYVGYWTIEGKKAEFPITVTGDHDFYLAYDEVLRSYDITFVYHDGWGEVSQVISVSYGQTPSVEDPTRATDAYYSYEFAGWTPKVEAVTGEATYTATWTKTPVEYTITFKLQGEEEIFYQVKGNYGDTVDYTEMPSTDEIGKTFSGWMDSTGTVVETLPETFTENVTFTGSYTVNQYTITFKGDFNTEKDDAFADYTITKNYGEAITAEDIADLEAKLPTMTGWEFLGWYYAEERVYEEAGGPVWVHTSEYEIPATMDAADVTVYAKWEQIYYLLNVLSSIDNEYIAGAYMLYEDYYKTREEFNDINGFCYDDSRVEDGYENLLPAGYTFAGYKYEDGTDVTFPYSHPAEDVTIIAQFVPIEYTITFMDGDSEYHEVTAAYGSTITAPAAPTKEGYVFAGWVDSEGKAVDLSTMPLNGMIVYASWTVDSFNVNFYATEGDTTAVKSIPVAFGTELIEEYVAQLLAQVSAPTKEGHTFQSWNVSNLPATMPAEAVNVYGTWSVNSYNVTWTIDGETYTTTSVAYGAAVTAPETPVKEGHTFSGWSGIPVTMPAEGVTVTGSWTVNIYTITFDVEGIDSITAEYGTAITWPENPTKDGFIFLGWDADGDGKEDTLPEKMPEDGLKLKAVWVNDTVYITWNIDGKETTEEYKYGDAITAPEATKESDAQWTYKFIGWTPQVPETALETTTYTAQFEQDEAVKYTVKFVNGEKTEYETQVAWNGQVTLEGFTAPTKEHYTLSWTVDGNEVTFPYAMDTKEVTFVANWTPITYTIEIYDIDTNEVMHTLSGKYGDAVPAYEPTVPVGCHLETWRDYETYEEIDYPETFTGNMKIYPYFAPNSYNLTFMDGENVLKTAVVSYDVSSLWTYAPEVTPKGEGYTQDNWLDADGNYVDLFANNSSYSMPDHDLVLYVNWVYTGWLTDENGTTYVIRNEKVYYNEWATIDGADYYFDGAGYIVKDLTKIDDVYFAFDHDTGKFLNDFNGIYTANDGDLFYVENGVAVENKGLVRIIDNNHIHYYYFGCDANGCTVESCTGIGQYRAQKSIRHWVENTNGYLMRGGYTFDADGVIEHTDDTNRSGIQSIEGVKFYLMDGVKVPYGLIKQSGKYYYARSSGALVVNQTYWVSGDKLNDLGLKAGNYTFDKEGAIVFETAKNGIYAEDDTLYYYVDGVKTYAGLIQYTGDLNNADGTVTAGVYDNNWIYVNTQGEVKNNCSYWISKTNGKMIAMSYTFDENGIMLDPQASDPAVVKEGIYAENGSLYYYVDNVRAYVGLIQYTGDLHDANGNVIEGVYDNDWIYVNTQGEVKNGCSYWISKNNGYMKNGRYTFDENGIMLDPRPLAQ